MKQFSLRFVVMAAFLTILCSANAAASVNVRDFGAKGDGVTLDTRAINDAIAAASLQGGGQVLIPAGRYLVHSIHLASHIDLHLETGAVLIAAKFDEEKGWKYDLPEPGPVPQYQDFGHSHWENSLIWGIGLEDVRISGYGKIDGTELANGYRTEDLQTGWGNKAISLKECTNVTLSDITIYQGGHFAILATGVDNLLITGLTIDTNRDGIDIDCCRNVRVDGCLVNSPYDDAIVLKASYALGRFRDTEDVTITCCNISGYDTGSVLNRTYKPTENPVGRIFRAPDRIFSAGRIKLGTETSGGFRNISVTGCTLDYSGGLFVQSMDGGTVENIVFSDITMTNCTDCPIFLRLGRRMRSPEGTPIGTIRGVTFSDIRSRDANPSYNVIISGIPGHNIQDLTMKDVHLHSAGGVSKAEAMSDVIEAEEKYPDPWMFGAKRNDIVPYSCMLLRHIDGVTIDGLYFDFAKQDDRQPFWIRDAHGIDCRNVTVSGKKAKLK